jgi:hypothetical protein
MEWCGGAQDTVRISVHAVQATGQLAPFWASQIIHPTESLRTEQGRGFLRLLVETGAARQYVRIFGSPEAPTPGQIATLKQRMALELQIYTAMIYEGPGIVKRINRGLCELRARDGFKHVSEAVGTSP